MAGSSLRGDDDTAAASPAPAAAASALWRRFVGVDVTNTFRALFAAQLSAVTDCREFVTQLATLMQQWRAERWNDIFIGAAATNGERRGRRRGSDNDDAAEAAATVQRQRGVAMYYESIRVQRLMEEELLLAPCS
ncbi:hypothetical protein DQ04_19871010, partial [Trypanosoma grayi]|uniref:hypothetical protein n=1 Tax=Trypanosoma grayi TaxID=71804 RepID=UPI0004F46BAF